MEIKNVIAAVLLPVALCACQYAEAAEADTNTNGYVFELEKKKYYGGAFRKDFYIYEDTENGVQYIICLDYNGGIAITPRYNADGTLYVGKAGK